MYFFHLFRSLLPLRNPVGFGASDFVIFGVCVSLVAVVLSWPAIQPFVQRLAHKPAWCMVVLGTLPIALRLVLLMQSPVPTARGSDEFSCLLLGDTLAHFRLANPTHPMHRFFETISVLQQPSYSSIYPLGQGLQFAIGQLLFGSPWIGVLLSTGAFCALCYWTLRAWLRPEWALLGGLIAVFEFGPLSYWVNSYVAAPVSGVAGCLVFGSLARLCNACNSWRARYPVLLGLGISLELLVNPFEAMLLVLGAVAYFVCFLEQRSAWINLLRAMALIAAAIVPAICLTLLQNKAVTHSWTISPAAMSRYEYGVPPALTFEPNAVPHRELTPDQDLDYRAEAALHGNGPETPRRFAELLVSRIRFYRLFLLPPLYIGVIVFLIFVRTLRQLWAPLALLIFVLGTNFQSFFDPKYLAAGSVLFLLISVAGLETLSKRIRPGHRLQGHHVSQVAVLLCCAHFVFWYGVYLCMGAGTGPVLRQYEGRNYINFGEDGRVAIEKQLAKPSGKQLVFVRYGQPHPFDNWIHNGADIDNARIVWARDLGAVEDERLRTYFAGRTTWLLEPDAIPPKLTRYTAEASAFETVP